MTTTNPVNPLSPLLPSGPICSYGPRLAYTYFPSPAPAAEQLNAGTDHDRIHFFTVDDQLLYLSFFQDTGPLNAACLYRFCLHVHTLLEDPNLAAKRIVLYSSNEPDKKANAALLLALYAMIVMRWSPADVLHPVACLELQPFRDAGYARADFHLSFQCIIYAISRAISTHLLDLSTFDLNSYETFEKVENGDWNWITPGFVAFASPVEPSYIAKLSGGANVHRVVEGATPRLSKAFRNVLEEFEKSGVKVVVRLNKQLYDASHFTDIGIEHREMYFDDGTNPTMEMTREFIDLADNIISAGGSVAVHCKAGLGRTGTLIGAYLIYKHGFTASEAIGFMRLMRPGSCVGPQQHFLYENQMTWVRWAAIDSVSQQLRPPSPALAPLESSAIVAPALELPAANKKGRRPITPPNEVDLSHARAATPHSRSITPTPSHASPVRPVAPSTPGRVVAVPGQPRKTPGKSNHSVARPEVRDEVVKGEMMIITTEGDEDVDDEEDDLDLLRVNAVASSSTAMITVQPPSTPRKEPSRSNTVGSTRIARGGGGKVVPNSAGGRMTRGGADGGATVKRTKSILDFGSTLFQAPTSPSKSGSGTSASGGNQDSMSARYPSRTASGSKLGVTGATTSVAGAAGTTPSRLPTRVIPSKRRGGGTTATTAVTKAVFSSNTNPDAMDEDEIENEDIVRVGIAGGATGRRMRTTTTVAVNLTTITAEKKLTNGRATPGALGMGRNVRRRRSSVGSSDFV